MKLHTDGILRVERIDDGCLALIPDAYPGAVTALGSHAPSDDPLMTIEFARLAARSNACIGLDLPADVEPGILEMLVTAAMDVSGGFEASTGYYHVDKDAMRTLRFVLAKLQPAGSPATAEPAPVSPLKLGDPVDLIRNGLYLGKVELIAGHKVRVSGHPAAYEADELRRSTKLDDL